jgi:hypothetical protein
VAGAIFAVAMRTSAPDLAWLQHVIMASELSGTAPIVAMAQTERKRAEAFLAAAIEKQPEHGSPDAYDFALGINFLLGSVERSGVLTLMLFGKDAVDVHQIAKLAAAATWHLQSEFQATEPLNS